jgi:hypothetical protein
MVTAKRKYKKILGKYKKTLGKYKKSVKKHKKHTFTNRVQIGCSNKKNKIMHGGGVNALSQPFENAYYALTGGISNAYTNFIGSETAPSPSIVVQPHLT